MSPQPLPIRCPLEKAMVPHIIFMSYIGMDYMEQRISVFLNNAHIRIWTLKRMDIRARKMAGYMLLFCVLAGNL